MISEIKTALILEGGGCKGAFEAGIIQYVKEHEDRIKVNLVGGTSVGGLNAACFAFGKTPELLTIWKEIDNGKIYLPAEFVQLLTALREQEKNAGSQIKDIIESVYYLSTRPLFFLRFPTIVKVYKNLQQLKKLLPTESVVTLKSLLSNLLEKQCLLDNAPLYDICQNLFKGKMISDAKAPELFITSFELQSAQLQVFGPDPHGGDQNALVTDAVMATSSIQGAFPVKVMGDKQYIDGGNGANLPIEYAVRHKYNRIILARDNSPDKPVTEPFKHLWDVVLRAYLATFTNTTMRDIKWARETSDRIGREERNNLKLQAFTEEISDPPLRTKYQSMLDGMEKVFDNKIPIEVIEIVPTWTPTNIIDFNAETSNKLLQDGYEQAAKALSGI